MSLVSQITPINTVEEKAKFLADHQYQPQFEYAGEFDAAQLTKWGFPQITFSDFAQDILAQKTELHLQRDPWPNEVVENECREILNRIGVKEEIAIHFDPTKSNRCSVSGTKITFTDMPDFHSELEFEGTINHELQTHLLRNLNQKKQGWKLNRELYDAQILRTEEGLAVLHSVLPDPTQLLWRPAAYYTAVALSQKLSFRDMFNQLRQMGFDEDFAWRLGVRTKRGLYDTSQPGGNTKDLCYLEGAVQMWHWLIDDMNQPTELYLGKIFIEELETKKNQVVTQEVYLPLFMRDMTVYRQQIHQIGITNNFDRLQKETHE